MNRLAIATGLVLFTACGEDVQDEAADLERPSGLVALLRSGSRADLIVADAEADGLRVLQLEGTEGGDRRSAFVSAPAVFDPVIVAAPGFPTVVAAYAGSATSSISSTGRVFALAPGSDALHATWIPSLPFGVSATRVDGHRPIGTLAINRPAFPQPELDPPVPVLSLLSLDPGLADFIPVDFAVVDERPFPGRDCPAGVSTGTVTRGLLLLQARESAGAPGAVVAMDLLTAEPGEPCTFDESDFPLLERSDAGVFGVRAQRVPTSSAARSLVVVPGGPVVVTTSNPEGGAGIVRVPGLDEPLSVQTAALETGGPASSAFPIPAGAGSPSGFAWLRSDEPLMELYLCASSDPSSCALSPFVLSGPFDDPDEGLVSGPGVLVLRRAPVVAGAFGFSPLGLSDALGGVAAVAAPSVEPGSGLGVAALIHRDGVVSILFGAPSQLSYVTRRERSFFEGGRVTTPAQRRLAEIFPRNPKGALTGPPDCRNQTTASDPVVVGQAPFACVDDPEPTDEEREDTTFFTTLRAPTECPGVEVQPRPLDGVFRATYRGPMFESGRNGLLGAAFFEFSESEIEVFFEAVQPPVDFVERQIRVGDAVHFFATCDAIEGSDIEVSVAATSTLAGGAGVVRVVEPQRLRFDFEDFTGLELETSPRQVPYDPAVSGPFEFASRCESVRVDRLEIYPSGSEAVLTLETGNGNIIEVVDRVPVVDDVARFTKGIRFDWQAEAGFECELVQGQDNRDIETGQLPRGLEPVPTQVPCENSTSCGPGRSCVGAESRDCPGACAADCASFGACFVGLVQRSCPEIELLVNGDEPLLVDLNPANSTRGGVLFPGAVPEAAVHVPNRNSVFFSFPGSRTLRELRFSSTGVGVGLTR